MISELSKVEPGGSVTIRMVQAEALVWEVAINNNGNRLVGAIAGLKVNTRGSKKKG